MTATATATAMSPPPGTLTNSSPRQGGQSRWRPARVLPTTLKRPDEPGPGRASLRTAWAVQITGQPGAGPAADSRSDRGQAEVAAGQAAGPAGQLVGDRQE